ncbi:MAG: EpsG family protein [Methylocystis sp.]|nr:EpsG family protein [Methylocystis sp.]
MWPYWAMFLIPAMAALAEKASLNRNIAVGGQGTRDRVLWFYVWLILTILIGFRFQVGGDWVNYFHYLYDIQGLEFIEVIVRPDPGYQLLNWVSDKFGWDIFGVNVVGGGLFALGLIVFCRNQPRPWLALTIAIPYLVIVVAMGYSRQAIALGVIMMGLVALEKRSSFGFVVSVAVAATFHKSAILLIPIAALANSRNRYFTIFLVGVVGIVLYVLLVSDEVETLYKNYVTSEYQSDGALIRLSMNAIAAVILIILRSQLGFTKSEFQLWRLFAILSVGLLGLFAFTPASTALDRVALYFLPLQIAVFAHAPSIFAGRNSHNKMAVRKQASISPYYNYSIIESNYLLVIFTITYFGLIQYTWLNFANNSLYWIPFRLYFLDG